MPEPWSAAARGARPRGQQEAVARGDTHAKAPAAAKIRRRSRGPPAASWQLEASSRVRRTRVSRRAWATAYSWCGGGTASGSHADRCAPTAAETAAGAAARSMPQSAASSDRGARSRRNFGTAVNDAKIGVASPPKTRRAVPPRTPTPDAINPSHTPPAPAADQPCAATSSPRRAQHPADPAGSLRRRDEHHAVFHRLRDGGRELLRPGGLHDATRSRRCSTRRGSTRTSRWACG